MASKISDGDFGRIESQIMDYLSSHEAITNRSLRQLCGVNYDNAIHIFNRMVAEGKLERIGVSSGTRYVRSSKANR